MISKSKLKEYYVDNKKILLRSVITTDHIAKYAKALSLNKKDAPIMITGYAGEGKSVLSKIICSKFDKRYNDDRNCIYNRKELMDKIENFPPSGFNIDEAINILYKRDWNSGGQKELVKVLNICRSKKHLIIFVQPQFTDMDRDIRNSRIRLWIFVIKRGLAAVFKPERVFGGSNDPWNLDENNKLIQGMIQRYGQTIGTIEGCYRSKNFLSFLRWDNISKEEYEAYEQVKDRKKYDDYQNDELLSKEAARKEAIKLVYEVCALLEDSDKLKRGWNNNIVAPYLNISSTTGKVYLDRARISLNISKEKKAAVNNLPINIDKLTPVKLD